MQYIGRIKLPYGMPAGLAAVIVGTALAWIFGRMDGAALSDAMQHRHFRLRPETMLQPVVINSKLL
jgi:hypothetical protein